MKTQEKTNRNNQQFINQLLASQDVLIIVGPSGIGKSTLVEERYPDHFVISSDNIVDQVCKKYELTFSEFFQLDFNHHIRKEKRKLVDQSIEESKNHQEIVWDLTNLTKRDRAKAMAHYPNATFKAVEVEFKGWEKCITKLSNERGLITGKIIPEHVLLNMFKRHEPVSKEEGFTEISTANVISSIVALKDAAYGVFQEIINQCDEIDVMYDATIFSITGKKSQVSAQLVEIQNALELVNCSITHIEDDSSGFNEDFIAYYVYTNLTMVKYKELTKFNTEKKQSEHKLNPCELNPCEKLANKTVDDLIKNPSSYLLKQDYSLDDFNGEPIIHYYVKNKFVVIQCDDNGFFIVEVSDENSREIATGISEKLSKFTCMISDDLPSDTADFNNAA
jgi:predicted kinase